MDATLHLLLPLSFLLSDWFLLILQNPAQISLPQRPCAVGQKSPLSRVLPHTHLVWVLLPLCGSVVSCGFLEGGGCASRCVFWIQFGIQWVLWGELCPQKVLIPSTAEVLIPSTVNVTLLGNRVFVGVIKVRWGRWGGPWSNLTGSLREETPHADTNTGRILGWRGGDCSDAAAGQHRRGLRATTEDWGPPPEASERQGRVLFRLSKRVWTLVLIWGL